MRSILREPLLHFLVLGALLLAADTIWRQARKPVVEITAEAVNAQATQTAQRLGRPLTLEEKERLAREMLQDEILFREAQKHGMLEDNSVRRTLVQMMRSSLKPVSAPPSDEELNQVRLRLPRENTVLPELIAFEHVSYTGADKVPAGALEKLRLGEKLASSDGVRLNNPLPPTYRPQIERILGKDFSDKVFSLPPNQWHGPLTSERGVHFVFVTSLKREEPVPLQELRQMLEARWRREQEDQAVTAEVEKLRSEYWIILPQLTAGESEAKP